MATQEPHISAGKWNYAPCGMQVGGTPCLCMYPTVVTGAGATVPYVNTGPANSEANNVHHELQTPETSA